MVVANIIMGVIFLGFMLYMLSGAVRTHLYYRARGLRQQKFDAWFAEVKKDPDKLEAAKPYLYRLIQDPHFDYHGPWER